MNDKKRRKSRRRLPPEIDNKPPRFDPSVYLKTYNLRQDLRRVREIDRKNTDLLQNMNIINRLGGHVNCWAPDVEYKWGLVGQRLKNDKIMRENKIMLQKIQGAASLYPTQLYFEDWKAKHEATEHRSRYVSVIKKFSSTLDMWKQMTHKSRTRCFFEVGVKEEGLRLGRIVFALYDSVVPRTCENFAAFCRGINGLSYKHTLFHRIVAGCWCQGGDVTKFNGTGGTSIYGDSFDSENFELRHETAGVLSMCPNDEGRNDSKFNLTFKRLETIDGSRVVFGRVIAGIANVHKIQEFGTRTGKPIRTVIVLDCGVLPTRRERKKLSRSQKKPRDPPGMKM